MNNNILSVFGFSREKFTIPAKTVYTIDFGDNRPNYFRVNNMSDVTLYFSTLSIPSESLYDFKANPSSVAPYGEPTGHNTIYCYNPSNKNVDIIMLYWSGEFDPSFLALSNLSIAFEGSVTTDGVIKSITCPLPSGRNEIGIVDLESSLAESIKTIGEDLATHGRRMNTILTKDTTEDIPLGSLVRMIEENTGEVYSCSTALHTLMCELMYDYELPQQINTISTSLTDIKNNLGGGVGVLVGIVSNNTYTAPDGFYIYKVVSHSSDDNTYKFDTLVDGTSKTLALKRDEFNNVASDIKTTSVQLYRNGSNETATIMIKEL